MVEKEGVVKMRRYELTISTNYVPDWGYIEAFRELFQNALDNEIVNPENKMSFSFDSEKGEVSIKNKTSILEVGTLLLGSTTKADDESTIGKHGEGYKIAFMVLLREGKTIKVYNYGNKEIWKARLVKSKRYNGNLVPVISVERGAFWKTIPDNDLTITVGNVTQDEYDKLVEKNLNLQEDVEYFEVPNFGKILTNEKEKGNIYVKGLFVCRNEKITYGYDFEPRLIELDRDRKLVEQFKIVWETSAMWRYAYSKGVKQKEIIEMIKKSEPDVTYFKDRRWISSLEIESEYYVEENLAEDLAQDFIEEHGEDSVPVVNNDELEAVRENNQKPVIVTEAVAEYLGKATRIKVRSVPKARTLKEQYQELLDDIEHKLTDQEIDRFVGLIEKTNV